jgi:hypothetical protein
LDKDVKIIAKNIFGKKLMDKLCELMPWQGFASNEFCSFAP